MTLIDFLFSKLQPPITWSDKSLKSIVSEYPSTSNMVNGPNIPEISVPTLLSYSLITIKSIEFENGFLIDMPNLGTAC